MNAITPQEERQQLYDTMIVLPWAVPAVESKTKLMFANKERYEAIAHHFPNPGLHWWLVALIHEMECSQNFNRYLGNGQRLDQVTTIVPDGRGPFATFEDGAIDAIHMQQLDKVTDWSTGNVLYILEGYNGYGYSRYHNMASPYLWSGSNHYVKGKYVADGKFDPEAVSSQIGIALMMKEIFSELLSNEIKK